jgi:peptidoglycan/LPS O-acetylase OafA/YrhL
MKSPKLHLRKLDYIRGFAAAYVILHHFLPQLEFIPTLISKGFFAFGQEAVMLFFILSGFVIYVSVHNKPNLTFQDYFIKRFRRIYFPFLVAIVLSIAVYAFNGNLEKYFSVTNLLGNLFMLQDLSELKPGIMVAPFLGNHPFWSLAYEWWFYMLFFPIYKYLFKIPYRIYYIAVISLLSYSIYIVFPNQIALLLSYFITWWCGVEAGEIYLRTKRFTFTTVKPILICLFLLSLLSAIPCFLLDIQGFGYYPFLIFRHFFSTFLYVLIGLIWYRYKLLYFEPIFSVFAPLAGISYGLYIFHYPLLLRWNLKPYISNNWLMYLIKFGLIFLISYIVEIKLQPLVNKVIR